MRNAKGGGVLTVRASKDNREINAKSRGPPEETETRACRERAQKKKRVTAKVRATNWRSGSESAKSEYGGVEKKKGTGTHRTGSHPDDRSGASRGCQQEGNGPMVKVRGDLQG